MPLYRLSGLGADALFAALIGFAKASGKTSDTEGRGNRGTVRARP
ncbi:hypothetical protein [Marinobacterium sediminicola]|uniref:Uncharacterized protein n=1 Tax=Marinobacterium sediminicola TaxID=518898 RepID=A0ABY1RY15_9GAMM|nr:hypothetical protein [Marinobacterium sediminicola]SMR73153.1 hypothetical protein SAMN04487964_10394 [Marinobacterium sediminicola]